MVTSHFLLLVAAGCVAEALATDQLKDIGTVTPAQDTALETIARLIVPASLFSFNLIVASIFASLVTWEELKDIFRSAGMRCRWLRAYCYIGLPFAISILGALFCYSLDRDGGWRSIFPAAYIPTTVLCLTIAAFCLTHKRPRVGRTFIIYATFLVLIVSVLVCVNVALNVDVARKIGSAGIILLSISMWAALVNSVCLMLVKTWRVPIVLVFLAIGCVYITLRPTDPYIVPVNHRERAEAARLSTQKDSPPENIQRHFERWLLSRYSTDPGTPIPIYLVASEGGGLRAAYWTARILTELDEHTEGDFSKHVFAYSGVSGGSLGLATFLDVNSMYRGDYQRQKDVLDHFYSHDFLSPVLGRLLFTEPIRWVFPSRLQPMRRDTVFEKMIADDWLRDGGSQAFFQPLQTALAQFGDNGVSPVVIFNATIAETGEDAVFSNVPIEQAANPKIGIHYVPVTSDARYLVDANFEQPGGPSLLTLAEAVHLSARFPLISPPASLYGDLLATHSRLTRDANGHLVTVLPARCDRTKLWSVECSRHESTRIGTIVDGGYYDNSGTASVRVIFEHIERRRLATAKVINKTLIQILLSRVSLHIIVILNDPEQDKSFWGALYTAQNNATKDTPPSDVPSEPLAAFKTLLSVRAGNADRSRGETRAELRNIGIDKTCFPPIFWYNGDALGPGHESTFNLELENGRKALASCQRMGDTYAELGYAPDLSALRSPLLKGAQIPRCGNLKDIVDPPLGWALSVGAAATIRCLAENSGFEHFDILLARGGYWKFANALEH